MRFSHLFVVSGDQNLLFLVRRQNARADLKIDGARMEETCLSVYKQVDERGVKCLQIVHGAFVGRENGR